MTTVHRTPILTFTDQCERADKWQRIARLRRLKGAKRFYAKSKLTIEQKMQNPAYAAAVAFNKKHGIGIKESKKYGSGYYRAKNAASKFKMCCKRKQSVSLPKITMPMAEE